VEERDLHIHSSDKERAAVIFIDETSSLINSSEVGLANKSKAG
jgi:hypothetical protein